MRPSASTIAIALFATLATLASARPFVDLPASDFSLDFTAGDWKHPSLLPPANVERRAADDLFDREEQEDEDSVKAVKNPKFVLNPKNPAYSSSLASISSARASRSSAAAAATRTTTTATTAAASTTTQPWYAAPRPTTTSAATSSPFQQPTSSTITTTTTTSTTTTTTTTSAAASTSPAGTVYSGGIATYFYQNGNPGNCGNWNQDSTYLVALPTRTYANGKYCGQYVTIRRASTGKEITAIVADSCPSCINDSCLDLSVGAFQALEPDLDVGIFDIEWWFN
ncbi:hypothetical protein JCM11251_006307 [Rhodosporidiobolus azoricus]